MQLDAKWLFMYIAIRDNMPKFIIFISRSYYVFAPRVLWPRNFLIFIVGELKNFEANIFLKLVC